MLNIQGLATKTTNKLEMPEIREIFLTTILLCLQKPGVINIQFFYVENLQYFELNRTGYKSDTKRSSGGLVVYFRDSILKPNSKVVLLKESYLVSIRY